MDPAAGWGAVRTGSWGCGFETVSPDHLVGIDPFSEQLEQSSMFVWISIPLIQLPDGFDAHRSVKSTPMDRPYIVVG